MKGLVFQGVEQVQYRTDLVDPQIEQPADVIVEVRRAGLCGSDLHQFHGRELVGEGTIPGHEFVGEIVAVGESVQRLRVGDQVFSPFTTSCGECFFCRNGLSARCRDWHIFGYRPPAGVNDHGRGLQGAQAEFVRVPMAESTLIKLPAGLSPEAALLLGDNFTTGYFAADIGEIRRDGITVVIGCGAVGLSAIVAARYFGAETIVAIDRVASRRARADSLGAVAAEPEMAATLIRRMAEPTGRHGADTVLEAVGIPDAQRLAFELVRPGGVIVAVGVHTADRFAFSPAEAYDQNLIYKAGRCPVRSYLDQILPEVEAGRLDVPVDTLITNAHVPLSQGVQAYEQFSTRSGDCVKLLLDPTLD